MLAACRILFVMGSDFMLLVFHVLTSCICGKPKHVVVLKILVIYLLIVNISTLIVCDLHVHVLVK